MITKTLFLTAGHQVIDGKGNGAFGVKETSSRQFDEAVEARILTDAVIAHLWKYYDIKAKTDDKTWSLQSVINWIVGNTKKDDLAIEIHFNAAAPSATGTEVIIPKVNDAIEREFANILSFKIADCLGIRNRGVKTEADTAHKSIGILNKPKAATNLLIEICFITNINDVNAYRKRYFNLVQVISDTIGNYLTGK